MKLRQIKSTTTKGFTLIELAIVGIFLGLLALFSIAMFGSNATTATKAKGLYEAATKTADNWSVLSQSCGVTSDITATDLSGTGATPAARAAGNLSMLLGTAPVNATTYKACYDASGIRPLSGTSKGGAGAETIYDFPVTVDTSISKSGTMAVSYANVPVEVALSMYQTYSSAAGASTVPTLPAIADTASDPQFRITAAANGKYTVAILRTL